MSACGLTTRLIAIVLSDRVWTFAMLVVGALLGAYLSHFYSERREKEKRELAIYDEAREVLLEFGVGSRRREEPDTKFLVRITRVDMQIAEWFPKAFCDWRQVHKLVDSKGLRPEDEYDFDQKRDAALKAMRNESKVLARRRF